MPYVLEFNKGKLKALWQQCCYDNKFERKCTMGRDIAVWLRSSLHSHSRFYPTTTHWVSFKLLSKILWLNN